MPLLLWPSYINFKPVGYLFSQCVYTFMQFTHIRKCSPMKICMVYDGMVCLQSLSFKNRW